MKHALATAAAVLMLPATAAVAFPQSFGLPHFVQVDEWLGDFNVDRMTTRLRSSCGKAQTTDRHCTNRDGKSVHGPMPVK